MGWFSPDKDEHDNNSNKEDKPKGVEFKPEEMQNEIKGLKTTLEGVTSQFGEFKPAMEFLAQVKAERDAAIAAKRNQAANVEIDPSSYLENPEAAINQKLQPIVKMQYELLAEQKRREILEEKDYYHGDFKSKVDAMLSAQPVEARINPTVIENCYKVILADHMKDVADGKLKTRAAMITPSGTGTGGHSGKEGQEDGETLSAEEKHFAAKFGLTEEAWKKSKKEMSYV